MKRHYLKTLSDEKLKRVFLFAGVTWITVIGLSLFLNWQQGERTIVEMATVEAKSTFNRDLMYRRWVTMHGGVYVPQTEQSPPNPYLSELPHRDVVTTEGQKLTLINPAYMTRQVHELGLGQYGVRGHITSLKPLRPQNYPDAWEEKALRAFGSGIEEISSLEIIDGKPYLRFIRTMIAEQGCLKCHEKQGYQVGDIRGGISVSVPYAPYLKINRQQKMLMVTGHCLIGFIGLIGLLFGAKFISKSQSLLYESEKRHRMAIRATNDGIWEWDILTNQEYFSSRCCEIVGYEYNDPELPHTFASWSERIHPDDFERVMGVLSSHLEKGGKYAVEYRHRHKSGEYRWLKSVCEPECDESGKPIKMFGSISDITERKQVEQSLLHERNLSMDMLNTQPSGAYRVRVFAPENWKKDVWQSSRNTPYAVELVSDAVCNILGVTQETFENTPGILNDLIYPDDKEAFAKKNEEAAAHLDKFMWEGRLLIDGVIRWIDFQSLPRPLENGDVLWTGTLLDITDRKRAEEEKLILEQQLQHSQKLESLGVLSGGIAHDFNNILAAIIGYCGLTKMNYEKAEKNIPEIEKAAERAAGLCRQMMAYAGKAQLTMTKVNMVEKVDDIVCMLKSTLPQNAVIKTDLLAKIPLIECDASQLRQVVMNLIINASEAIGTEQGEVNVSLAKVKVEPGKSYEDYHGKPIPSGDYVCLEVTDNGIGIDEATKWRIFEPFYTTKFTGRGLGMSAVLGIVKSHAGALQLFSQPGRGTTFKVYLPALANEIEGDEVQSAPVSATPWQGSGTILLAEDEGQVRDIAKELLEMFGFTVLEAVNGKEALEIYLKNAAEITLVLTDMGMPVMDGYELFSELKKLNPELPLIVSSGYGDAEVSARIGLDNIAGIISKPYNMNQLQEVLKTVVEGTASTNV